MEKDLKEEEEVTEEKQEPKRQAVKPKPGSLEKEAKEMLKNNKEIKVLKKDAVKQLKVVKDKKEESKAPKKEIQAEAKKGAIKGLEKEAAKHMNNINDKKELKKKVLKETIRQLDKKEKKLDLKKAPGEEDVPASKSENEKVEKTKEKDDAVPKSIAGGKTEAFRTKKHDPVHQVTSKSVDSESIPIDHTPTHEALKSHSIKEEITKPNLDKTPEPKAAGPNPDLEVKKEQLLKATTPKHEADPVIKLKPAVRPAPVLEKKETPVLEKKVSDSAQTKWPATPVKSKAYIK